jgi:hypothetical protein
VFGLGRAHPFDAVRFSPRDARYVTLARCRAGSFKGLFLPDPLAQECRQRLGLGAREPAEPGRAPKRDRAAAAASAAPAAAPRAWQLDYERRQAAAAVVVDLTGPDPTHTHDVAVVDLAGPPRAAARRRLAGPVDLTWAGEEAVVDLT